MKEIEENILYIDNEIKKQELKKQNMDVTYYLKQLNFYKEKNIIAKDEIIDFLIKDIKNYAIEKSQKEAFSLYQNISLFIRIMPYRFSKPLISYSFHRNDYDVRELTPISNKFLNAPARSYPDIKNLYNDNKEKFSEFAKMYISEKINGKEDVITEITNLIETNHI